MEEEKLNVLKAISLAVSLEGRPVDRVDITEHARDYRMPLTSGASIRGILRDLRREGLVEFSLRDPEGYNLSSEGVRILREEREIRGEIPTYQREEGYYGIR